MSFAHWPCLALATAKKTSPAQRISGRGECAGNPRAIRRSGCAPAEPYPPNCARRKTKSLPSVIYCLKSNPDPL